MTQDIKIRIVGDASGVAPAVKATEDGLKRIGAAAGDGVAGSRKLIDAVAASGKSGAASLALTRQEALALNYTLSDVAASLASGTSPLTILFQQGGQVKDAFGGLGPLFSKLGALITPVRVVMGGLAAAVGSFAFAAYKGHEQSEELARSLQLTGNYAGVTEGQVNSLTRTIARASNQTVGTARDVLTQVIATGEIGPRLLEPLSVVVAKYAKATGESAQDAVKDFARMGDGVAKWAAQHNRSLNFITAEQYAYIKRLEEQGKAEEAEMVVLDALGKHLGTKLPANMGVLERAWSGVKGAASSAWDAMLGVGRASTIDDKIEGLTASLERARRQAQDNPLERVPYKAAGGARGRADASARADAIEEQLRLAKRSKQAQLDAAAAAAEDARTEKLRIGAVDYIEKIRQESKGIALVTKELQEYRRQVALLKGTKNEVSPAEQALQEKAIRDRYRDKAGESEAQAIARQQLKARLDGVAAWVAEEADLYRSREQALRRVRASDLIGDQAYLDGLRNANEDYLQHLAEAHEKEVALLTERRGKADPKERAEIDRQLAESAAKYANAQRDAAAQVQAAFLQMDEAAQSYARTLAAQNERTAAGLIQDSELRARVQAQLDIREQRRRVSLFLEGTEARKNAEGALADYIVLRNQQLTEDLKPEWQRMLDGWKDTNRLMRESFDSFQSGWLKSGEDAWVEFVKTGKVNTKSLVDFVLTELARVQFRQNLSQGWGSIGQWIRGLFNGGGSAGTYPTIGGGAEGGYVMPNLTGSANGNAFSRSGMHAFAGGGVFTNKIVSSPTYFAFRNGAGFSRGVMGEAGDEAIMPLARGRNGKLGVYVQDAARPAASLAPVVNIHNNGAPAQAQVSSSTDSQGRLTLDVVLDAVATDVQRGGRVAAAHQQVYGLRRNGLRR